MAAFLPLPIRNGRSRGGTRCSECARAGHLVTSQQSASINSRSNLLKGFTFMLTMKFLLSTNKPLRKVTSKDSMRSARGFAAKLPSLPLPTTRINLPTHKFQAFSVRKSMVKRPVALFLGGSFLLSLWDVRPTAPLVHLLPLIK